MVRKELPQDTEEGCVALLQQLKSQLDVETVDRQLRQGGEPGLTDDAMRRWLVARKWDVKAAHRDLTAHAAWRASYCPNGRIKEVGMAMSLRAAPDMQGAAAAGIPCIHARAMDMHGCSLGPTSTCHHTLVVSMGDGEGWTGCTCGCGRAARDAMVAAIH